MPKKNHHSPAAHRTRKRTGRRINKKGPGRPGADRSKAQTPRIIANSIFALTLKDKPGMGISRNVRDDVKYMGDSIDYHQMYRDLLKCFQHGIYLVTGERTKYDPLKSGLDIGTSLHSIINGFKRNVAQGFDVNIERIHRTGKFCFIIYDECNFNAFWHAFEVKPVVKLIGNRPALRDLYILVLKAFMATKKIEPWWGGGLGAALYHMEAKLENWEDYTGIDPDEDSDEAREDQAWKEICQQSYDDYNRNAQSEVMKYQKLLEVAKVLPVDELISRINKYEKRSGIYSGGFLDILREMCKFIKTPHNMHEFDYEAEENEEGLKFPDQVAIIWDINDPMTAMQMEIMDAEVNGCGICFPRYFVRFTPKVKSFSKEAFNQALNWPIRLGNLYSKYDKFTSSINTKNK